MTVAFSGREMSRRRRVPMALLLLAVLAAFVQAAAFVALGRPSRTSQVLRRARGGADDEDEFVFEAIPTTMAELKPGMEMQGVISFVSDRIAMADVGVEKAGMIPASKMAEGRVDNPQDKVKVGDGVKVWVVEVDKKENIRESRLILAMNKNKIFDRRSFGEEPDMEKLKAAVEAAGAEETEDGKPNDRWLTGMVTQKRDFGCFVAFRVPGVEGTAQGLVYRTELKGSPDVMDKVKVRVVNIDDSDKISLSMMSSAGAFAPFYDMKDEWVEGVVKNFADFGAFVQVESPDGGTVDGLLPNREISEERIEDPAEVLEEGQSLKVRILEVSEKGLALSLKQLPA
eukprot:CAMPEP_0181448068 /NCGR_PEP_ID=MMETSP1110-20121109/26948_1 /TAXON_ID=174948 /ORGANISM="Symbiodinium sp., Strain CCMP421" /LENGTH=341 /DNA_ID=CAMNT_0023572203 /DNA_START=8 /DNA_END=1033 /DNA_ORIENTATION=-